MNRQKKKSCPFIGIKNYLRNENKNIQFFCIVTFSFPPINVCKSCVVSLNMHQFAYYVKHNINLVDEVRTFFFF